MSPTRALRFAVFMAPLLMLPALAGAARAQGCDSCGGGGHGLFCNWPTATVTRSFCWRYRCVCPKPVCDPCRLEHYGFYQSCWHPWPFPPDYRHCEGPAGPCAMAEPAVPEIPVGPTAPDAAPLPAGPMPKAEPLPPPRKDVGKDDRTGPELSLR